jgi:hypothetical protein
MEHTMDSNRRRRTGVAVVYGFLLIFVVAVLTEAIILRGCGATTSCSPVQRAAAAISVVIVVAGILVIGVFGWKGQLPGTRVDRYESRGAFLQRSSVTAVVLLTLASGGFYIPVWFHRRRKAINSLDSPLNLWKWGPAIVLVLQIVTVALQRGGLFLMMQVASIIAVLALSFRVRSILAEHSASRVSAVLPGTLGVQAVSAPSSLLTFLLNIWYLQYAINELIDEWRVWDDTNAIIEGRAERAPSKPARGRDETHPGTDESVYKVSDPRDEAQTGKEMKRRE